MELSNFMNNDGSHDSPEDFNRKINRYFRTAMHDDVETNHSSESKPSLDVGNTFNISTLIHKANCSALLNVTELIIDQFNKVLCEKHELMLQNETLLTDIHESEVRERTTKLDGDILRLEIKTLKDDLLKLSNNLSNLQSKYHKEVNKLKADLDQKDSEVLMLKNDFELLQLKYISKKKTTNMLKNEIKDLNLKYTNEIEVTKKELDSNTDFMNIYKVCSEEKEEKINKITKNIEEVTKSLDSLKKKNSLLINENEKYRITKESEINTLTKKLNASEEIVKYLCPGNAATSNFFKPGTTITDVYTIYKETSLKLQATTQQLEQSKKDYKILEQQIIDASPRVDKMEKDLVESNHKLKTLNESISVYELKLRDVSNELKLSITKCEQLTKDNEKLSNIKNDLSNQICFLLRNEQCSRRQENRGKDLSPQSIITNNYLTYENIQDLQKLNIKLIEILRSLSETNDKQEIESIQNLKEEIKFLKDKLEKQTQLIAQQSDLLITSSMQSIKIKLDDPKNDVKEEGHNKSFDYKDIKDYKDYYKKDDLIKCEENVKYFKFQLNIANTTINNLKKKLESRNVDYIQLNQHIQGLNGKIHQLLGELKMSNTRYSENTEKLASLQNTISSLKNENHLVKMEIDCIKNHYNNLKIENDNKFISNLNYSCELKQKTKLLIDLKTVLTSQLYSLSLNRNLTPANIFETGYDNAKSKQEYNKLIETVKDIFDSLLLKLEKIEKLSSSKEMKITPYSLYSIEHSNFLNLVGKLVHEIKYLLSRLYSSEQLKNQYNSELYHKNTTEQPQKLQETNFSLTKETKTTHVTQSIKLNDEINNLKGTIRLLTNESISKQLNLLDNKLINQEHLNNNKLINEKYSIDGSTTVDDMSVRFTKMVNVIKVLKAKKNYTILQLKETTTECNNLKFDLENKSKIINDLQTQIRKITSCCSSSVAVDNHSEVVKQVELNRELTDKIKILEQENILLSNKFEELQKLEAKKTKDISTLTKDMSLMQLIIEQKSAKNKVASCEDQLNSINSDAVYLEILHALETEKEKTAVVLDKLKSMKSDKSCLEELFKKLETDTSREMNAAKQKITKLIAMIVSINKTIKLYKNTVQNYRQKFISCKAKMHKIILFSKHYLCQNKDLNSTLNAERIVWQIKLDNILKRNRKISVDSYKHKKHIEQVKQEQMAKSEPLINELFWAKTEETNVELNAVKAELEVTKAESKNNKMHAEHFLQDAKNKVTCLSKELHNFKVQCKKHDKRNGFKIEEFQVQITRLKQENQKLATTNEKIKLENYELCREVQNLNQRVTVVMNLISNQKVFDHTKMTITPPPSTLPFQPVIGNKAVPSVTVAQTSSTVNTALIVQNGEKKVPTAISQPVIPSATKVSNSQSCIKRNKKRNENCQVVEHLSRNSASLTSPNLVTKSTNHTTELSDTCQFQTAHLNKLKRKRKNNYGG